MPTRFHGSAVFPIAVGLIVNAGSTASAQNYPYQQISAHTSTSAGALATADLNQDGRPDFVTLSNLNPGGLSMVLSDNSLSGWTPTNAVATGGGSNDVAIADFNNDGLLDFATANTTANTISIILQTAPGVAGAAASLPIGSGPTSVRTGDVNNDGNVDIIANASNISTAYVYPGNGAGGFGAPITFLTGDRCERPTLGEFSGDGILDLAVRNSNTTYGMATGNGNGTFGAITSLTSGNVGSDLRIADMNVDGRADVVGCSVGFAFLFPATLFTFLGNGDGTFNAATTVAWLQAPSNLAVADLNQDGIPDAVTNNTNVGSFGVNQVAGAFGTGTGIVANGFVLPAGSTPGAPVITDIQLDGIQDIAFVVPLTKTIIFVRGKGNGALDAPRAFQGASAPLAGVVGDVNHDGRADIIQYNLFPTSLQISGGDGLGGFTLLSSASTSTAPGGMLLADMNANSNLDLIVTGNAGPSTSSGHVSIHNGAGNGTFAAASTTVVGKLHGNPVTGDFDLNGTVDLITTNTDGAAGSIYIFPGNGLSGLGAPVITALPATARGMVAQDVNADGQPDIAVALSAGNAISFFASNGIGGYLAPQSFLIGAPVYGVAIHDVTGDYLQDILVTCDGALATLAGNGGGTFTLSSQSVSVIASAPRICDVTRDGIADLICATQSTGFAVFPGTGNGLFQSPTLHGPTVLVDVVDTNSDGLADVVGSKAVLGGGLSGVFMSGLPTPPSTFFFGTGTPGCRAALGTTGNVAPTVGNTSFGFVASNAPATSLGLLLISNVQDLPGSDPFGLLALLHVDLLSATEVYAFDIYSDPQGAAFYNCGIANVPTNIGLSFHAQTLWVENASTGQKCSNALAGIVTSRGCTITILP